MVSHLEKLKIKHQDGLAFSSVSIAYFAHSTENEALLSMAVCFSLGVEHPELQKEILQGYFGNEIVSITAHLIGRRAEDVAHRVILAMDSNSKTALNAELKSHMDEHDSLFIRVDKESLVRSREGNPSLQIGEEEAIRIKLRPKHRAPSKEEMMTSIRRLLE